jgi:hypothetical protein
VKTLVSSSQKISQLALQHSSPGALIATIDFRDQKSSTSTQHSGKKQTELQNSIYSQEASYDQRLAIHHHIHAGREKNKGKQLKTQGMLGISVS